MLLSARPFFGLLCGLFAIYSALKAGSPNPTSSLHPGLIPCGFPRTGWQLSPARTEGLALTGRAGRTPSLGSGRGPKPVPHCSAPAPRGGRAAPLGPSRQPGVQLSPSGKLIAASAALTEPVGKGRGSSRRPAASALRPRDRARHPRPGLKAGETAEPPPPAQPSPAGARPGATPRGRQPVTRPPFRAALEGRSPPALTQRLEPGPQGSVHLSPLTTRSAPGGGGGGGGGGGAARAGSGAAMLGPGLGSALGRAGLGAGAAATRAKRRRRRGTWRTLFPYRGAKTGMHRACGGGGGAGPRDLVKITETRETGRGQGIKLKFWAGKNQCLRS